MQRFFCAIFNDVFSHDERLSACGKHNANETILHTRSNRKTLRVFRIRPRRYVHLPKIAKKFRPVVLSQLPKLSWRKAPEKRTLLPDTQKTFFISFSPRRDHKSPLPRTSRTNVCRHKFFRVFELCVKSVLAQPTCVLSGWAWGATNSPHAHPDSSVFLHNKSSRSRPPLLSIPASGVGVGASSTLELGAVVDASLGAVVVALALA